MGSYNKDWFAFEIESLRHILDLTIEPSFAPAACFQFHQMQDNFYRVFWNIGMTDRGSLPKVQEYVKANESKIDMQMPFSEFLKDAGLAKFMKRYAPIHSADLSSNDMEIVNAVANADWTPAQYGGGLDGHSYTIKIYGDTPREFHCWCRIPAEWTALIPLVNFVIGAANLQPRNCYEVKGVGALKMKEDDFGTHTI